MYKKHHVVCYEYDNDSEELSFGKIDQCLVTGREEPLFLLTTLTTIGRNEHYHSIEVKQNATQIIIEPKCLIDYHPLHLLMCQGRGMVVLKYHLFKL